MDRRSLLQDVNEVRDLEEGATTRITYLGEDAPLIGRLTNAEGIAEAVGAESATVAFA